MPKKTKGGVGNIGTVAIFYRHGNPKAVQWARKIRAWLKKKHPSVRISDKNPEGLIALGGDGVILEAVRRYQKDNPVILGLNLGRVGFLASAREPKNFLPSIDRLLKGRYLASERIMLEASIVRKGKIVLRATALNDISIQNLLGVSEIEVEIE